MAPFEEEAEEEANETADDDGYQLCPVVVVAGVNEIKRRKEREEEKLGGL